MKRVSILSAYVAIASVHAWWDQGHLLVGEVATQVMAKEDVATVQSILGTWNGDYPNTGEITTATIWADLIKCNSISTTYCPSPVMPAVKFTDDWHYIDLPCNVNGTDWKGLTSKDVDRLIQANIDGRGLYTLHESLKTIAKSKSKWSVNFVLRFFLHVFGDIHQPCHSATGISDTFPGGDIGGNNYQFTQPCSASNLHALWDNAAGTMTINWYPTSVPGSPDRLDLTANATALLTKYASLKDPLNYADYAKLSYADFVKAVATNKLLEKTFLDSYDVARSAVYAGIDLNTWTNNKVACPSAAYQAKVVATIESRIVLGGRRMAVVLAQFAKQLRAAGLA
ncbi:hypothetical protein DYB32_002966 [Aphanomyces invadans]|uniref:Uncharacterized protein n=1 Tax=Aphanomyces invadans TaxID=157072 RepID=A0A418B1T3_9STRA|nr:hypothetical protein DYB32_002966 [Aphanomyces invadans]